MEKRRERELSTGPIMSVTATFVMSAVVVFITVFCFVASRYSMFSDEKPREQRNNLYPPDCRRPNPCAYVVISNVLL